MQIDYRKLCKELFHTDNVEELKKIAKTVNEKNIRNAGRRKKFSEDDIITMKKYLSEGKTVQEIAEKLGTSRQIINKYVNLPPEPQYTMRIKYIRQNKICTLIDVDFLSEKVKIQNRTDDLLYRAFGVNENPSWKDFNIFLSERCFPQTRKGAERILKDMNLDNYDTLQILEKTGGVMADDNMRMEFQYYKRGEVQ